MDRIQAEENIQVIREIMERSARYTHFSGISGIAAGLLALAGCWATTLVPYEYLGWTQIRAYIGIWLAVFVLAVAQDLFFAHRKARRHGETLFGPALRQVVLAVLPGVFLAFIVSLRALTRLEIESIPAIWSLGYGVAACAAGIFSVKEVRIFGAVQLLTGAVGLFFFSGWVSSFLLLALSFGFYHILFGVWLMARYGR
ncbi:MAG: hypothetical protein ACYC2Y_10810 [Armatimonadota bacterium]